jgi:hypothetical protein
MSRWRLLFPTLALTFTTIATASADEPSPPAALPAAARAAAPIQARVQSDPCDPRDKVGVAARWGDGERHRVVQKSGDWRLRWQEPTIPADAPRVATVTDETSRQTAKPTQQSGTPPTTRVVVRAAFRDVVQGNAADSPVTTARYSDQSTSQIRLTQYQVLSDPLDDPFGGRRQPPAETVPTPSVSLQPPATSEPYELPPARPSMDDFPTEPGPPPFDPAPAVPDELPRTTDPSNRFDLPQSDSDAPEPPSDLDLDDLAPADPDADAPAPPPSLGPLREPTKPCQRVYNGRNCCTEDSECEAHRRRVRDTSIQMISLDITPLMTVTQLDSPVDEGYDEYQRELADELRKAPARVWRNRSGEQVADGRMTNFRRGRVQIETEDGQREIPFAELSNDDMCFVTAWWNIPSECVLGDDEFQGRQWIASTFTWKASSVCHKPLYFQDVQLERYGHTAGPLLQPALSGAHFFLNIAALPYNMALYPPYECRYPLGYYRPGSCAPWMVPPVPLSVRAGLIAAGTYVGGVFLIP